MAKFRPPGGEIVGGGENPGTPGKTFVASVSSPHSSDEDNDSSELDNSRCSVVVALSLRNDEYLITSIVDCDLFCIKLFDINLPKST